MSKPPAVPNFLHEAAGWTQAWGLAIEGTRAWLATHAVLAGDSRTRRTGLLGRASLPPGEALVIAPCQGIHTAGMRFPIDVVGVARDGRVVTIATAVTPWRVTWSWRAFAMVEVAAGGCAASGLVIGAKLCPRPLDL